jgi:hypothetical protein
MGLCWSARSIWHAEKDYSGGRMKISERTVKRLGEIITGDKALSPYRSGPKLVSFFHDFGTNHAYGQGFPSRWTFAEDCLRGFNDTPALRKIILTAVDPRDFMGATVFDKESRQNNPANINDAVTYLNKFLPMTAMKSYRTAKATMSSTERGATLWLM